MCLRGYKNEITGKNTQVEINEHIKSIEEKIEKIKMLI